MVDLFSGKIIMLRSKVCSKIGLLLVVIAMGLSACSSGINFSLIEQCDLDKASRSDCLSSRADRLEELQRAREELWDRTR